MTATGTPYGTIPLVAPASASPHQPATSDADARRR